MKLLKLKLSLELDLKMQKAGRMCAWVAGKMGSTY